MLHIVPVAWTPPYSCLSRVTCKSERWELKMWEMRKGVCFYSFIVVKKKSPKDPWLCHCVLRQSSQINSLSWWRVVFIKQTVSSLRRNWVSFSKFSSLPYTEDQFENVEQLSCCRDKTCLNHMISLVSLHCNTKSNSALNVLIYIYYFFLIWKNYLYSTSNVFNVGFKLLSQGFTHPYSAQFCQSVLFSDLLS